jgi:hypothetical protein
MRRALGTCAVLLGAAPALAAQVGGHLDLGLGGAHLPRRGETSLWSLAPELRWQSPSARLAVSGEYRDFGSHGRGATGRAAGSWFTPLAQPAKLELFGEARGQSGQGLAERGAWEAGPRMHLASAERGVWLAARAGMDAVGGTYGWEAAAWRRFGALSIQILGRQTTQSVDVTSEQGVIDTLAPPLDTLSPAAAQRARVLTDFGTWLRWEGRRVQLAAAGGVRFGLVQPGVSPQVPGDGTGLGTSRTRGGSERWWQADVTYWVTDRFALASSVGRHPSDPSLLAPGGGFLRMSLRASLGRRGSTPSARLAASVGFRSERLAAGVVEFSLPAGEAQRVELMGDFTDWSPRDLERDGRGRWRIRLPVEPGLHRVNVRYDGGPWLVPPGARPVADEFQLVTGEVIVG